MRVLPLLLLALAALAAGGPAPDTPVHDLLVALGEPVAEHHRVPTPEGIERGRQLVTEGRAVGPDGRLGPRLSGAFTCTHCHNVQREDPDLRVADPVDRLRYAEQHDLPLLPGTTLWGLVDRSSWFNGDYVLKYGDLVAPAHRDLRNAIRLCTAECSQGRVPEDWEVEAMLDYFWSIPIRYRDLDLDEQQRADIDAAIAGEGDRDAAVAALRGAFLAASPATKVDAMPDRMAGWGAGGDAARGEQVYRRSCLHCHARPGPGRFGLDQRPATLKHLAEERFEYGNHSIHQALRYGTRPYAVPLAYMPFYPLERLDKRLEDDLTAYLEAARGNPFPAEAK